MGNRIQSTSAATDVPEFIEGRADNIKCFAGEGEIKTTQAVAAIRKITIEAMRKMESTEQALSASKTLAVQFKGGGKTYFYEGVPESLFGNMAKAESVGKFITGQVVGKFKHTLQPKGGQA